MFLYMHKNTTDLRFTNSKEICLFFTGNNFFSICCSCSYPGNVKQYLTSDNIQAGKKKKDHRSRMNVSSTKLFQTEIAIAEGREDKIIRMQSKYMKTGIHISLHQIH